MCAFMCFKMYVHMCICVPRTFTLMVIIFIAAVMLEVPWLKALINCLV